MLDTVTLTLTTYSRLFNLLAEKCRVLDCHPFGGFLFGYFTVRRVLLSRDGFIPFPGSHSTSSIQYGHREICLTGCVTKNAYAYFMTACTIYLCSYIVLGLVDVIKKIHMSDQTS